MSEPPRDDPSRYLRTELLERIAHELRGPAGVTLGALDELEQALDGEQVERHKQLFSMARRGARRVLRTAERLTRTALLESSQLAGGGAPMNCAADDLCQIVQQAAQQAELIEGRSSVQLTVSVPAEPCLAAVDRGWFGAALAELVAQSIRCARRQVRASVERADDALRICVRDDRIASSDLHAQRFVPIDDRRDAALGWPLVCDVARAHRAELRSEPLLDRAGAIAGLCVTLELAAAAG